VWCVYICVCGGYAFVCLCVWCVCVCVWIYHQLRNGFLIFNWKFMQMQIVLILVCHSPTFTNIYTLTDLTCIEVSKETQE
jgi:hypothetical protein